MKASHTKAQNLCGFGLGLYGTSNRLLRMNIDLRYCAENANRHHDKVVEGWESTLRHAHQAGKILLAAKKQLGHGRWLPWLKRNFKGSERNAQNYMLIARCWKKVEKNPNFSINEAIKSLTSPATSFCDTFFISTPSP